MNTVQTNNRVDEKSLNELDKFLHVVVLVDNNPHPQEEYKIEHGLSIYFEIDGCKWLYDVGASDKYYFNALKSGIDIEDVDFLVLSHAHNDHTGGLEHFLSVNKKAKIFLSNNLKEKFFYSHRHIASRNIGINYSVVENNIKRFVFVEENTKLSEHIFLISKISHYHTSPLANRTLFVEDKLGERLDDFTHEIAIAVKTSKELVVLSSCSHNGVLNIIDAVSDYLPQTKIIAFIGGTHLVNSDERNQFETEEEMKNIAEVILHNYPSMKLITGHCTGSKAQTVFSKILKDNFKMFYSGAVL